MQGRARVNGSIRKPKPLVRFTSAFMARAGKRQGGARLPKARELHEAVSAPGRRRLEAVRLRA